MLFTLAKPSKQIPVEAFWKSSLIKYLIFEDSNLPATTNHSLSSWCRKTNSKSLSKVLPVPAGYRLRGLGDRHPKHSWLFGICPGKKLIVSYFTSGKRMLRGGALASRTLVAHFGPKTYFVWPTKYFFKKQLNWHKIHTPIYPFNVYNSMVLSIFTELYNHYHHLILELFHHPPQKTLYPLAVTLHPSSHPQPLATTNLLLSLQTTNYFYINFWQLNIGACIWNLTFRISLEKSGLATLDLHSCMGTTGWKAEAAGPLVRYAQCSFHVPHTTFKAILFSPFLMFLLGPCRHYI